MASTAARARIRRFVDDPEDGSGNPANATGEPSPVPVFTDAEIDEAVARHVDDGYDEEDAVWLAASDLAYERAGLAVQSSVSSSIGGTQTQGASKLSDHWRELAEKLAKRVEGDAVNVDVIETAPGVFGPTHSIENYRKRSS